jgi:hypothetical protein
LAGLDHLASTATLVFDLLFELVKARLIDAQSLAVELD